MEKLACIFLVFISTLALCSCQLEGGLLQMALMDAAGGGGGGSAGATGTAAGSGTAANDAPLTPQEIQLAAQLLEIDLGQNNGGMGGGMGGMMGGMGGMGGAGAGAGGMGGMMNQIDRITRMAQTMGGELGPGGISRMIRTMVTPMITGKIVTQKMNELVKVAVGPHASPSQEMLDYARLLKRPPSNPKESAKYITMMVEVAKKDGIFMPDGSIQKPVLDGAPAGTKGPTLDEVRGLIMKRSFAFQKAQKNKPADTGSGMGGGMGGGLGGMGALNAMGGMGGLAGGMGGFGL